MPKYSDTAKFRAVAAHEFDFLTGAGFLIGSSEGHRLLYASAVFSVEVLYDSRDGRVVTIIDGHLGERNLRASLVCLFVESGSGPAQKVRETARSRKTLSPVLASQASALRELLPELTGPRASDLLLRCHGS